MTIQIANLKKINMEQVDKCLFICFSMVLIIMAAIRDNVGLDYGSYLEGFEGLHNLAGSIWSGIRNDNYFEPLYNLLNILAPTFRAVIIICTGLGVLTKVVFFGKTNTRLFCLFLYFCSVYLYYDMGIMRQGISISLVWFALRYVKEEKTGKFFLCIIIASLFHVTAILAIPVYLLGDRQHKPVFYIGLLAIGLAVAFSSVFLTRMIIETGPSYIAHKVRAYTTYLYTENSIRSLLSTVFIRLILSTVFWCSIKKIQKKRVLVNGEWLYFNAFFISIIETVAMSSIYIIATRGTAALYFCYIPLFSVAINDKVNSWYVRLFIYMISVTFVLNTFTNILLHSNGGLYLPYKTFLWKER